MPTPPVSLRVAACAGAALVGFAANSLLCRAALRTGDVDPWTFTAIRIGSGAAVLAALVRLQGMASAPTARGDWSGAGALAAYALAFSLAYVALPTGTGALLLFGAVQATMIVAGLRRGERPRRAAWLGFGVAAAGVVTLVAPGVTAPDPGAAGLMVLAGIAWGIYSLLGRGAAHPLRVTAGNFIRAVPLVAAAWLAALPWAHVTTRGATLAAASGALASGVGYSFWYAAVPSLPAIRAAMLQLTVPALVALGGAAWLGEPLTVRLVLAGGAILGGVAVAVARR